MMLNRIELKPSYLLAGAGLIAAAAFLILASLPGAVQVLDFPLNDGLDSFSLEFRGLPPPLAEIEGTDGTRGTLRAFYGKVTVVNIWATWCPPCIVELPSMERMAQHFSNTDLQIVTIAVDQDGWPAIERFNRLHGVKLPVYLDASGPSLSQFEYFSLPTTIILDRNGLEIGRQVGSAIWDGERGIYLIQQALDGSL